METICPPSANLGSRVRFDPPPTTRQHRQHKIPAADFSRSTLKIPTTPTARTYHTASSRNAGTIHYAPTISTVGSMYPQGSVMALMTGGGGYRTE